MSLYELIQIKKQSKLQLLIPFQAIIAQVDNRESDEDDYNHQWFFETI